MRSARNFSKMITFEPTGYITGVNVQGFQKELNDAILGQEQTLFLVDMSRVEFLDSSGLMALASSYRLAQTLGKRLCVCSVPPSAKIVFELTQLDQVFDIYDSRDTLEQSLTQTMAA